MCITRVQKELWESNRLKRPRNAYIQFTQDFLSKHASNYDNIPAAVAGGS